MPNLADWKMQILIEAFYWVCSATKVLGKSSPSLCTGDKCNGFACSLHDRGLLACIDWKTQALYTRDEAESLNGSSLQACAHIEGYFQVIFAKNDAKEEY